MESKYVKGVAGERGTVGESGGMAGGGRMVWALEDWSEPDPFTRVAVGEVPEG